MEQVQEAQRFDPKCFQAPTMVLLSCFLGLAAGLKLHDMLKPVLSITDGDASRYEADMDAIMAKYQKVKKSGGDFFTKMEPYEIVNAAYGIYAQKEASYSVSVGSSNAMGLVDQRIESTQMRDGDRYFEESNSSSTYVKLYNRMYQEGDQTTKYWGSTPNYASDKPVKVDNKTYKEEMGRNVSDGLVYIVSDLTESKEDFSGEGLTKVQKNKDGTYTIDMEVDPLTSTLRYVRQMKTISNLKAPPNFSYVHLRWNFTSDLTLRWFQNKEKYQATLSSGIGSPCAGTMTTIYFSSLPQGGIPEPSGALPEYPKTEAALLSQIEK